MPDVPTFENELQPHMVGMPEASPGPMGAPGAALERAGAQIESPMQEFNLRYQDARRQADASSRLADYSQKLGDAEFRWSKTPDRTAALAGYNAEAADLRKQMLTGVGDDLEQQILQREFDTQSAMRAIDTGHAAFTLESHKRVGELDVALTQYAQQIAATDNPALKAKLNDQAMASLHSAVAAGWLDPEEGSTREIGWKSQVDEVAARQMMNTAIETQNPALAQAASRAINDANQFPNLTAEKRELLTTRIDNLMIRIENRAIAAQAHADAVSERNLHIQQGRNATIILGQVWAGKQIDMATLENLGMSGQLSESGMSAVHTAIIQQQAGHNDAMVVSNLWHKINLHDADASTALNEAITNHQVNAATAGAMTRSLDAAGPTGKTADSAMYAVLRTQLHGDIIEQGRMAGDASAAERNWVAAQGEWAQRVTVQHQDPTMVLTDLMAKYAAGARPTWLPPLLTGAKPYSWKELQDAAKALRDMRDNGELNASDFASQDALMRQYGRFIHRPAPAAPRPPAQGAQQ